MSHLSHLNQLLADVSRKIERSFVDPFDVHHVALVHTNAMTLSLENIILGGVRLIGCAIGLGTGEQAYPLQALHLNKNKILANNLANQTKTNTSYIDITANVLESVLGVGVQDDHVLHVDLPQQLGEFVLIVIVLEDEETQHGHHHQQYGQGQHKLHTEQRLLDAELIVEATLGLGQWWLIAMPLHLAVNVQCL